MKRHSLVVLATALGLVLVAGLISSAAWANHIPGATYDGTTSSGGGLTFTVSADGSGIDAVTVGDGGGSTCPSAFTLTIDYQLRPEGPLPIVNHAFEGSDPPYLFEGSFPTTQTAQGSFETPDCSSALSWSATLHTGPESPPPPSAPGTHPPSGAGAAAPTCGGKAATIVGTNDNDLRKGTPGKDVMVGLAGNDKLSGLAGNDLICGGSGKDTLKGGKGKDKLYGQKGKDTLKGGPGKDILKRGGKDTVQSPAPLPLSDSEAYNAAAYDAYQRFLSQPNNPDAFWGVGDCSRESAHKVRCEAYVGFYPMGYPGVGIGCDWHAVVTRIGYDGVSLSRENELCA